MISDSGFRICQTSQRIVKESHLKSGQRITFKNAVLKGRAFWRSLCILARLWNFGGQETIYLFSEVNSFVNYFFC